MSQRIVPARMADARARVLRRSALLALVAVVSSAHPAAAEHGEPAIGVARGESPAAGRRPIDLVKGCVTRVVAVVQSQPPGTTLSTPRRAQIRQIAEELFDFDEMARRALGQHWKDRSPQEQTEFVGLFVNLLEQSYLTAIGNFPLSTITFQSESVSGEYADVRSRIIADRHEIPVDYRLLQSGGRWGVYDVVADGVSLISSYRSQFNTIIRTASFAQLLERLRSRQANVTPRQGP
jgi:phospholipid transport system substrate-binding protein